MRREISIGEIDRQLCSATLIDGVPENLEWRFVHNSNEYWVNSSDFNNTTPRFRIARSSPEGERIRTIILHKNWEQLDEYMWKLVFKKLNVKQMKEYIRQIKDDSFDEGKQAAKDEFRNWLNG